MAHTIAASELIINPDGTIFHLHLRPEQLADKIILVGDPARSHFVASFFDSIEHRASNREYVTHTGICRGERLSVISTGMGVGCIDILMNELDALANIDLETRQVKNKIKQLTLVRLGTCGAVQSDLEIGDFIATRSAISFDSLASYYHGHEDIYNIDISASISEHFKQDKYRCRAVAIDMDRELCDQFTFAKAGITASAIGFYGPQGRSLRVAARDQSLIDRLASWRMGAERILNLEMESSSIATMAKLMGHRSTAICTVVAQRRELKSSPDYGSHIAKMVDRSLEILTNLK